MNEKFETFLSSGLIGLLSKKPIVPEERKRNLKRALIIYGIIFGLLLILFFGYIAGGSSAKCDNVGCFITKANQCKAVTYEETSDIGKISYSIKTNKDGSCVLTKEVKKLSENEDASIKKILEKKKMECVYYPDEFNGQWITSMIEGVENCSGELKDSIGQLLLLI